MKNILKTAVLLIIIASLLGCESEETAKSETTSDNIENEVLDKVEEETTDDIEIEVSDGPGMVYHDADYRTEYANVFDFDSYDGSPYFAVAFLGYGDRMEARNTYVAGIFSDLDDFAIENIGHIDFEGDEWYLVVPRYMEDVDITNLDTGEVHTVYNGEAFTVKCNLSDLHSNIEISTERNLSGHKFSPQMDGDGKFVPNPDVWDITDYVAMTE
ncbi:MAG: hypothetical protein IJO61_07620 [Oscillospiraceae bacterium]|nr:hypothetical protein [Oscillospiraceae bacterium]